MAALDKLMQLYGGEEALAQPPAAQPQPITGREAWALAYRLFERFTPEIKAAAHRPEEVETAGGIFRDAARQLSPVYTGGIIGKHLALAVYNALADIFEAEKPLDGGAETAIQ